MGKLINLTRQRFGRLFVMGDSEVRTSSGGLVWRCLCSCGKTTMVQSKHLIDGHVQSCGCFNVDFHTIHGYYKKGLKSREYSCWEHMIQRCYDVAHKQYKNYGGRGIKVCDRWLESFDNFYEDMGNCPDGLSLDRKDNEGDYYKENCRWATWKEQQNNRRNNVWKEYKGEKKTVSQWACNLNMDPNTLGTRFNRGWSIERALTTPVGGGD